MTIEQYYETNYDFFNVPNKYAMEIPSQSIVTYLMLIKSTKLIVHGNIKYSRPIHEKCLTRKYQLSKSHLFKRTWVYKSLSLDRFKYFIKCLCKCVKSITRLDKYIIIFFGSKTEFFSSVNPLFYIKVIIIRYKYKLFT